MGSTERYRRLEVQRRRAGGTHPDRCLKLRIDGAAFALPPRGLRVAPRFDVDGRATLELVGADAWPEAAVLCRRVAKATSGGVLTVDPSAGESILADLMALARRALLRQYDLSDEQVAELLSFATDQRPQWIDDLLRWAQGVPRCMPRRRMRRWWPLGRRAKGVTDAQHD